MAMRWYVIHVYSGSEKKVAQSIEEQAQQAGMEDLIEEVLVPMEEVVEMRRGAKINAERKFFPGYVLVRMDLTDESWHLVKNTPKVTDFLGGKGRPSPIRDSKLKELSTRSKKALNGRSHPSPLKLVNRFASATVHLTRLMVTSKKLTKSARV